MRPFTAIILAAGKTEIGIQTALRTENPALVKFNGRYMYRRVVETLELAEIGQIVLVGSIDDQYGHPAGFQVVPGGNTLQESLQNGLEAASFDRILVLTVDLPVLKPEAVISFLDRCTRSSSDLCYSAVPVDQCYAEYPGVKRTSFRFSNGEHLTGGNLFYGTKSAMIQVVSRVNAMYQARKNPFKLAGMFGWGFLIRSILIAKFKIGKFSKEELLDRASAILDMKVGLILSDPSAATDTDDLEQLRALEACMRHGGRKPATT